MEKTANQCERLRTTMLTAVFDLVYSTFWISRSERERHPEHFLRVQVVVKRLAEALAAGPKGDGSTPRAIRECVGLLAQEVERLAERHELHEDRIAEARLQIEQIGRIADRMVAHCSESAAEKGVRMPELEH